MLKEIWYHDISIITSQFTVYQIQSLIDVNLSWQTIYPFKTNIQTTFSQTQHSSTNDKMHLFMTKFHIKNYSYIKYIFFIQVLPENMWSRFIYLWWGGEQLFIRNSIPVENAICCFSLLGNHTAWNIFTCHDSTPAISCAKLCSNDFIKIWIRVKRNFHRILITIYIVIGVV